MWLQMYHNRRRWGVVYLYVCTYVWLRLVGWTWPLKFVGVLRVSVTIFSLSLSKASLATSSSGSQRHTSVLSPETRHGHKRTIPHATRRATTRTAAHGQFQCGRHENDESSVPLRLQHPHAYHGPVYHAVGMGVPNIELLSHLLFPQSRWAPVPESLLNLLTPHDIAVCWINFGVLDVESNISGWLVMWSLCICVCVKLWYINLMIWPIIIIFTTDLE